MKRWTPWIPYRSLCAAPLSGPVTVMFRSGMVDECQDAASLRWEWHDVSELAQIVAYSPGVSDPGNAASNAGNPPAGPIAQRVERLAASLEDFGKRLAAAERMRVDEGRMLSEDMEEVRRHLQVHGLAIEALQGFPVGANQAQPKLDPEPDEPEPVVPMSMLSAARTLVSMGYTWKGGCLWQPPLGKPPQFFGDSEGGAP